MTLLHWSAWGVPHQVGFLIDSRSLKVLALAQAFVTCLPWRQRRSWCRRAWHWSQYSRSCAIRMKKLASDGLQDFNKIPHSSRDDVSRVEDCRPLCCPSVSCQNSAMLAKHTVLCAPRQTRCFEGVRSQFPGANSSA